MGREQTVLALEHPVMNAAGTCKTVEDVRKLAQSSVAAVMVGSITLEPRPQNEGTGYWSNATYSLNSLGLPNPGLAYYREHLTAMVELCQAQGKPLVLSVAAFGVDELVEILAVLNGVPGLAAVELNLGCPNVWTAGEQKRIFCFDLAIVQNVLDRLPGRPFPIGLKVSPFSDPAYLRDFAALIDGNVDFVTAINTFPNAYALENGRPAISATDGYGGLAGPALKPIALGQVRQYCQLLTRTSVFAAGGVTTGADVIDYLRVGAEVVQVNTAYANRGTGVFSEILEGYAALAEDVERDSGPSPIV